MIGSAEPVRLRGHHLLCMLTFVGEGYSPGFVAGMAEIVDRIAAGAPVLIVDGPDDICAAHVAETEAPHCLDGQAAARDAAALADIGALLGLPIAPGMDVTAPDRWIETLRAAFAEGAVRRACAGCDWKSLCTSIAAGGYAGARLAPQDFTK